MVQSYIYIHIIHQINTYLHIISFINKLIIKYKISVFDENRYKGCIRHVLIRTNHNNKRVLDDVAIVPSKRIRNKIAGYATKLMKRIQKGPVRGISLKIQEEERERRMEAGAGQNQIHKE